MKNELFAPYKGSLTGKIIPFGDFKLFSDIDGFKIDPSYRERIIADAEKLLDYSYKVLPASVYMQYKRNGNRSVYEGICFERRNVVSALLLAEYIERKGRFTDKLIDGVWLMLEETTWVIPAHNQSRPDIPCPLSYAYKEEVDFVDLFSAETGSLMAWVYYLGKDFLDAETPLIRDRILYELNRRIILPYLTNDNHWWMGKKGGALNNWTPWIVSNVLAVAALTCTDDETRERVTEWSLVILDRFTSFYQDDGGCDEGPGYWSVAGASYFDCLEILYDLSGGLIDVFDNALVRAMGEYIAKVNISGNYYLNFADAHARVTPDMYMIERFGRRVGSTVMRSFASARIADGARPSLKAQYRTLKNIAMPAPEKLTFERFMKVWLSGIQIMTACESADENKGLYLAAKGGYNAESHNHNDVGSFMVYADGKPLFIDVGVGTYTAKTFSRDRYRIWTMQSCYHNLPTINGITQQAGAQFKAEDAVYDAETGSLTLSLAHAYPREAGIKAYIRSYALIGGEVRITDDIALENMGTVEFNLITPDKPDLAESGVIALAGSRSAYYDKALTAALDEITLDDRSIANAWQREKLYRIRLSARIEAGKFTLAVR